jgi:hypothetical protein
VDSSVGDSHAPTVTSLQTETKTKNLKQCILEEGISFDAGHK